ncbi:MAG TPA: tRNA (adenosine(37)-N6)-threonylcarbamoyltransferase complex transferase subunit TsaD [Aggregatilineales bacterium]|nr:tRNA (adenosine(37)-N6)-threonylcarbamoyltransferase complex transferase subunit TsaD [Aggregatilineales bacterium]HPV05614.1 tRNA (adenosine(37)-N6)-threonylcarbamoyltransferase complex transferase subunit TsaD [Aggregatilineales bacterium]HQA67711.1 tRNA (adenosine(37)-N6)-threonylcarbamoyltransferase complex transferase subunit TsaD [Aggregatilineales bacterium]HQE18006.1 tRNA (adenosine(37)-N6)-threonylcarbamoyltransferase complex transferase subunit TsaD [Aggregatilineales bacterium]
MTLILAIESSCDETSAAIVEDGRRILANVISSQVDIHAQFGGIFPEIASRAHIERIYPVVEEALDRAGVTFDDLDAIAVTRGPGLAGSLVVGVNMAKGLALARGLPIVAVNHLEGHTYSLWLAGPEYRFVPGEPPAQPTDEWVPIEFPVVVLIVSGGHTELLLMTDHGEYRMLGSTLDDAAGEAFDKVGRLLNLPYPGGPSIQRAAEGGDPAAFDFPRVWLRGNQGELNYDFSFSGLKTAVLRKLEELVPGYEPDMELPPGVPVADLAASFQAAVVDVLVGKTVRAAEEYGATEIFVAGGVSANAALRAEMIRQAGRPVRVPPLSLCTDNAAMIAAAGYFRYMRGQRDTLDFDVLPTWPLAVEPPPNQAATQAG